MGTRRRIVWFALISFSLLYQGRYFGVLSAIKSAMGVSLGVLVVWIICTVGRRLRPDNCTHWLISHIIGYPYTSGAKGLVKRIFDLFVWYFGFGILLNYSLALRSLGFPLSMLLLTVGLIGVTLPWVERKCERS